MVESIAAKYHVRLLDQISTQIDLFDRFTSIELNHKLNGVGSYTLMFEDLEEERVNRFIVDGQVEIYRTIPGVDLSSYVEYAGFHRKRLEQIPKTKKDIFGSVGVGYNSLLERTNIAYKEGTIRADKFDAAETVMKEYVEENCGPTASTETYVGRMIDGVLPYFSVQSDQGRGPLWSGSRAFENLLDTLQAISNYAKVDFDVIRTGSPWFTFVTYSLLKGADRTTVGLSGGKNSAGNAPVTLSVERGNVQDAKYENDRLSEANVCMVLGDGEGSTREVLTRNTSAVDDSPWNRVEVARPSQPAYIPGLSEEATAELKTYSMQQTGDEVLEELQAQENFTFTPLQQPSTLYGKHYFLGDRITVKFRDFVTHKRIIGVKIKVQKDRETITLEVASFTTGTQ